MQKIITVLYKFDKGCLGKEERRAFSVKDLMRSKNTSGYFSFYIDNISIKTYST